MRKFRDAVTNGFDVAWISGGQAFDPDQHSRPCTHVVEAVKPCDKRLGLPDLVHRSTVAPRLRFVKKTVHAPETAGVFSAYLANPGVASPRVGPHSRTPVDCFGGINHS